MNRFQSLLFTLICATSLMGCTITTESHVYEHNYRPNRPHYIEPMYYERPVVMRPHLEPVYAQAQGVARPERFACGADVYTGKYNCVPRRKAHFVRPMGYAPTYRPY